VKNFLIRKMSTGMNVPEKIITSVIDHQFVTLIENMPTCNSLELSGFGKFMFLKKKAPKTMLRYMKEKEGIVSSLDTLDEHARKRAEIKISKIQVIMKALNQKLQSYENQFCTNLGGMEKSIDSPTRDEGTHTGSGS